MVCIIGGDRRHVEIRPEYTIIVTICGQLGSARLD